jgi:purine-binding chemotaxis protein CheW
MSSHVQLTTFYIDKNLYGIEVMSIQEVTGNPKIVPVPLSPSFVLGMINLRGQIATALGLRTLFGHAEELGKEKMSVVCKVDGNLVSLIVDSIGEVVEVENKQFESPPETIPVRTRKFLGGICKMEGQLLSVIDLGKLFKELSHSNQSAENIGENPEIRRTS